MPIIQCMRDGDDLGAVMILMQTHIGLQSQPPTPPANGRDGAPRSSHAWGPIVLARKPLSKPTIAANVLKWGTGALNIDGCRVEGQAKPFGIGTARSAGILGESEPRGPWESKNNGRWPANIIHALAARKCWWGFPETDGGGSISNRSSPKTAGIYGAMSGDGERWAGYADIGSACPLLLHRQSR